MILTILLDISKPIASFCYMTLLYRRIVHSNYQILSIGHCPIVVIFVVAEVVIGSILACWFTPFRLFFLILFDFDFRKDLKVSSFDDSLFSCNSFRGFFFYHILHSFSGDLSFSLHQQLQLSFLFWCNSIILFHWYSYQQRQKILQPNNFGNKLQSKPHNRCQGKPLTCQLFFFCLVVRCTLLSSFSCCKVNLICILYCCHLFSCCCEMDSAWRHANFFRLKWNVLEIVAFRQ